MHVGFSLPNDVMYLAQYFLPYPLQGSKDFQEFTHFQAIFISPVEVVKIQLQVTETSGFRPSVFKCIGDIYANYGLKGFTRGYLTCFMREPLAFAAYFSSFELMTK